MPDEQNPTLESTFQQIETHRQEAFQKLMDLYNNEFVDHDKHAWGVAAGLLEAAIDIAANNLGRNTALALLLEMCQAVIHKTIAPEHAGQTHEGSPSVN